MDRGSIRPIARFAGKFYKWGATLYGVVYLGLKGSWVPEKASDVPEAFADVWEFAYVWGWLGAAIIAATSGPAIWVSKKIQPEQVEKILKTVLTGYRAKAMPPNASEDDFRVTLFKFRRFSFMQFFRWCFGRSSFSPWSGWLCPYVRPGHCRNKSSTRLHASLQEPRESEGVAGMAFVSEEPLIIQNLPSRDEVAKQARKKTFYLNETRTPEKWLTKKIGRKNGLFPRSFYGCRVLVDGKPWGVLLFDSEHDSFPDPLNLNAETKEIMKVLNSVLSSKS